MDGEAWHAAIHGVARSWTRLSNRTELNFFIAGRLFNQLSYQESPVVKNLPAIVGDLQETRVLSLGQKDPLEKEMATPSRTLAWRIPWTEEPGRTAVHGVSRGQHDCTHTHRSSTEPACWSHYLLRKSGPRAECLPGSQCGLIREGVKVCLVLLKFPMLSLKCR